MKKILFALSVSSFLFFSCGDDKKKEVKEEVETKVEEVKVEVKSEAAPADDKVALGEKLFTEKACNACHQVDNKVIGPALKDIATAYKEKNGNLVQFLKGSDAAIVDTDPAQVAIMKANIDGVIKEFSGDELQAVASYIRSTIK